MTDLTGGRSVEVFMNYNAVHSDEEFDATFYLM